MIDVYRVPLGASDGGLCGLQWRRHIDTYPLGDHGLGPWGEAEEAPFGAPLGDVRVHQVEEVSRVGVKPVARYGPPLFLLLLVAAEGGAFVLQGAHGCFMGSRAVRVAAVVLYDYAFWVCPLPGECKSCRGRFNPGHVRRVAQGYCLKLGGEPCLLVSGAGGAGAVIVGEDEV